MNIAKEKYKYTFKDDLELEDCHRTAIHERITDIANYI